MKTLKIFAYVFALACFSGAVSSCSSDDVEDNGEGATSVLPAISGEISAADGNDTRGSLKYNNKQALKLTWYEDDYIWAYSPSKQFYNKLVPVAGQKFGESTTIRFVSEGNVDYEPGETLILLYSGYKTDDSKGSGVAEAVKQITFKKRDNTTLAMICGNSEDGESVFSDKGNYFFFKASSATISADGTLDLHAALRSYMPLLRIGIPASDADDAVALGKLNYTIKVSAKTKEQATEGFPESVTYSLLEGKDLTQNNTLGYPADNYYTWGEPYVYSLKENGTSPAFTSYSLWEDKPNKTDYELNGYVFIPIPALNYTELNVVVTVSDEDGNSGLSNLCGTYSYTTTKFTVGEDGTLDATAFDKKIVNRVLQLGNIWEKNGVPAGGAWTFTQAN